MQYVTQFSAGGAVTTAAFHHAKKSCSQTVYSV